MQTYDTVYISFRRTNRHHARAIQQALTARGYDVFFDTQYAESGTFDRSRLYAIEARAHFVVLLTPSAPERALDPGDGFRREIEHAIDLKRHVIPL